MTSDEYREILSATGMAQTGPHSPVALGLCSPRTSRRWAAGTQDIDPASQIVLRAIRAGRLSFDEAKDRLAGL